MSIRLIPMLDFPCRLVCLFHLYDLLPVLSRNDIVVFDKLRANSYEWCGSAVYSKENKYNNII